MARKLVLFVALSLLAASLSVVSPGTTPAEAQGGGVVCSWVDTGTDFDVTWDLYPGADKYVIYRTVDGAGPYWRGAVNDPGTTFTSDAYPAQGGVVIYEVAVKDASNTEIDRATCTDNTGGGGNSVVCSWADTGTDFDVTWDLYPGADKYVIYRTVDGAGPYWRGAVNDPGTTFTSDAYPAQGGVVIYEVAVKDASNTEIDRATCTDDDAPLYCEVVPVPGGEQIVGLREPVAGAVSYDVERSNAPGSWTSVGSVDEVLTDLVDPNPGASPSYRVEANDGGGIAVGTFDCVSTGLAPGTDHSLYDLPTTPGGDVGGTGPGVGVTPTLVYEDGGPVPTTSNLPNTPITAGPVCSTNGLYRALPASGGPNSSVWASLVVPQGGEVLVDISNRKDSTSSGNWSAVARMHRRNSDGTAGAQTGSYGWAVPYWWNQLEYRHNDVSLGTNNGPSGEFLIEMEHLVEVSIGFGEKARYLIDNVRIVDANGDIISRPCDWEEVHECQESGNMFFPVEQTIDGNTYSRGCYSYEGCVADLPSVIGLLDGVSEWACENDEFLEKALAVGIVVTIVLGVIYLAPAVVTASLTGLFFESGLSFVATQAGVGGITTTINVLGPTAAGLSALAFWRADNDIPANLLETYVDQPVDLDVLNGEIFATGTPVVDQIATAIDLDTYISNNTDPDHEEEARAIARRGLETCVVLMASSELQSQVLARYAPAGAIQDGAMVTVGNDLHHLCEFIPIYIAAAGMHGSGLVMREATVHISEVVADTEGIDQATTPGSAAQQNPPIPQPQWLILNRKDPKHPPRWYRNAPYLCSGAGGQTDCDEWPAVSHVQGGKPGPGELQPHLSLIELRHNRRAGSDLGGFYGECGIGDTDVFLAIPVNPAILGQFDTNDVVPGVLRSQWHC